MIQPNYMQWCNENEGRAYPVAETAGRVSDSGQPLPDDILVDLGILVAPGFTGILAGIVLALCVMVRMSP